MVLRNYAPGDVVWVQDYHLMLLPALLKLRAPKMKARPGARPRRAPQPARRPAAPPPGRRARAPRRVCLRTC